MRPEISEFSYGYALTENLIAGTSVVAAPVFPSLRSEGQAGGYDVRIPFPVRPLFLQFKLSHYLFGRNARERRAGLFTSPFYRMYLYPLRHSQQHNMLLALEQSGNLVFYATPAFHTASKLNSAYLRRQVIYRSVFFSPSAIGDLPDNDEHYIAFQWRGRAFRFSKEPQEVSDKVEGGQLEEVIRAHLYSFEPKQKEVLLEELSAQMMKILHAFREEYRLFTLLELRTLREIPLKERAAYLARVYFGCELFLVGMG